MKVFLGCKLRATSCQQTQVTSLDLQNHLAFLALCDSVPSPPDWDDKRLEPIVDSKFLTPRLN